MTTYTDIKNLDNKTLFKKINELKTQLFNFELQKVTTGLEKVSDIKKTKKEIARLLTAVNAKK